ncbi:MAG TPA: hypothetical protein VEJ46_08560 [Candidatus Acidoferrum sp.]|nr:hypothetical protein [Candidatus Acidoferrum sp.]
MKDTTTRVRVYADRVIVDPPKDERGQAAAHLISFIGGDSEIGALWAGVTEGALFQIHLPYRSSLAASLGLDAQCFRGRIAVSNRERPVRHLVTISSDLAKTKPGVDRETERTILCDDDPTFVLYRVASRFGLPVVSEWAPWFMRELKTRKAIRPLLGLGCSPVLVSGEKATFLKWIGKALKEGSLRIPDENGSITWTLPPTFLEAPHLKSDEGEQHGPHHR